MYTKQGLLGKVGGLSNTHLKLRLPMKSLDQEAKIQATKTFSIYNLSQSALRTKK